jgi:hypothetical protein
MTNEDRELEQLAATWRASTPVGLEGLARRVRLRRLRSALVLGVDFAVSALALCVLGWLLVHQPSPLWVVWIVFMATFTIALLALSIGARRGTWRGESDLLGLLEQSRRQARASILLARGAGVATLSVLAFTAGWAAFEASQLAQPSPAQIRTRVLVYGLVAVYGAGWLVGCRRWIRRKTGELASLDAARAQMASAPRAEGTS